jgi:hypothetical protein
MRACGKVDQRLALRSGLVCAGALRAVIASRFDLKYLLHPTIMCLVYIKRCYSGTDHKALSNSAAQPGVEKKIMRVARLT